MEAHSGSEFAVPPGDACDGVSAGDRPGCLDGWVAHLLQSTLTAGA